MLRHGPSSAPAHHRTGWGSAQDRIALGITSAELLPYRARALSPLSTPVSEELIEAYDADRLKFFGDYASLADRTAITALRR